MSALPARPRLVSLDVFRGLTMAGMVIVNNPGSWDHVYWPLLHAEWHGWTPTDLIFPFFLFIVGVAITLSRKTESWDRILRRTTIIFALGLLLNWYPRFDLSTWRIPGVLQRIAICYLAAAAAYRMTRGDRGRQGRQLAFLAAALALVYWIVMAFVPAPGSAAGDLTPEGNLGAWIDRSLMPGHLWRPRWDPEGLLSTVPAISTALLGVVAGLWLSSGEAPRRKVAGLALAGAAGVVLAYTWHAVFPINKNLWTSSYVALTAGLAALALAACYWIVDVRNHRAWTAPFVILGSNAITLYVLSGLLADTLGVVGVRGLPLGAWIHTRLFEPLASPKTASLLYALAHLVILFIPLAWMHRRRIFLKV
ncbi:MAG TPA: heparan-alpha-glucosaminide N-acetyltransferase domain-containing protein [Vicinamibacterales bacterium]|nr:heparan-alpha-glucosaminide N-acetyltransferase domain-containing protein [Vicinamibacterales bacterium]